MKRLMLLLLFAGMVSAQSHGTPVRTPYQIISWNCVNSQGVTGYAGCSDGLDLPSGNVSVALVASCNNNRNITAKEGYVWGTAIGGGACAYSWNVKVTSRETGISGVDINPVTGAPLFTGNISVTVTADGFVPGVFGPVEDAGTAYQDCDGRQVVNSPEGGPC